ncbi:MAG: UDP-N-acetylenolpyruvoylglucosamine reductase [Verrucomicrobia bacterium]|nr:MAG: UDP-N-acetylenolpyruvoylglucosamine reductase [Verrucomicrobiota bacterium]PYK00542.1 MAG: UDP-N-acetylenolpyruvoylglucosamine reductase [Verrucomicrobiota bacterium]
MKHASELDLPKLLTREHHKIHLIGVAGSGMSGIAALLLELGHEVSGSDKTSTVETDRLRRLGLRFHQNHHADDASDADLIVFSSAIAIDNPILLSARDFGKPAVRRAEVLAAIMRTKRAILIAGMHGKTTTSAMTAHVLREAGLHPSHYVGAEIPILGSNAHWDPLGEYFVAEGDESDGTLRCFQPRHSLILNIEEEHLDFYVDLAAIEKAFAQLIEQTTGTLFYSADDANTARLCAQRKGAISYGFSENADYRGTDIELRDFASVFCVYLRGQQLGEAVLNVPGRHNVQNAIGVIALANELGISFEKIAASLRKFEHARRRFEIKYASDRFLLVDDYAHHPSEIRATLKTARSTRRKRVLAMFQPHRFSRTKALCHKFGDAFDDADRVVVTDVYPASETPIPGISGQTIADEIARHGHRGVSYQPRFEWVHRDIGNMLDAGDLILSMGAGNIHEQLSILAADLVIAEKLKAIVGEEGDVRLYEPLSKHTTLRVGGPAQFWVEPRNENAFAELIRFCRSENLPLFVIGRGSNLLVRDGGIRGVVVHPRGGDFDKIEVDSNEITAGVGAKLKEVAYAGKAAGIGGLEWMEGIPGAVGGGLRMNAGAMGAQTFENVVRVSYLDAEGNPHTKTRDELEVHYRSFPLLENNFAVSAVFRGQPAPAEQIARKLHASQEKRRTSQPIAKSAGCIFKNPQNCPAGQLVEELGLKNSGIGKARVSEVHGNFIVNDGGATAAEMLELIEKIKTVARAQRGIELETEVQIVGEPA